jgi:hypothetical protein
MGVAGLFDGHVVIKGNVQLDGQVEAPGKRFLIDHPLDPTRRVLRHTSVESPEALCVYRGIVVLDADGVGEVRLPGYFPALTEERRATVQLTPIGRRPFAASYEWRPDHGSFRVYGEAGREVSWMAMAERDDPAHRFHHRPVEEEKEGEDAGRYLHPRAYGRTEVEVGPDGAEP